MARAGTPSEPEDFENGKTYYAMEGTALRESAQARPNRALAWHAEHVFEQ
jgi:hypothetical protein